MTKSQTSIAKKMILWIVGSSIGIASLISAAYLYNDYQEKLKAVQRQLIKIEESVEKVFQIRFIQRMKKMRPNRSRVF